MGAERRTSERWVVAIDIMVQAEDGRTGPGTLLNVNLGGCFIEGDFGMQLGERLRFATVNSQALPSVQGTVVWIVDEDDLKGVGLRFDSLDEEQQLVVVNWYNKLEGRKDFIQ